jgi:XTP/dITP diphosphohydrolase
MSRKFDGFKLVIASHNQGKIREIDQLLSPFGVQVISAADMRLPEPEETGTTFAENAELKALAAAKASNMPALADDSGLAVAALNGDPGIYSARWAGPKKDFAAAMATIHEKLGDSKNRSAQFVCALSLAWPDGHVETFSGTVGGTVVWPPRGVRGFGYDPFFQPAGYTITFGEMDPQAKQRMSHRAEAFRLLVKACFE